MAVHRILSMTVFLMFLIAFTTTAQAAPAPDNAKASTVNEAYPGLASGGLSFAKSGDLPEGILVRAGTTDITLKDLDAEIGKAPETVRADLTKNKFFVLEKMTTKRLLLDLARKQAAETKKDITTKSESEILDQYIQGLASTVTASSEEIAKFYAENKEACGGATLEQVKEQLKDYVIQQKQQDTVNAYIRTLGQRTAVIVSASWAREQAVIAKDNPVDKARGTGKPTMVDFGADGCAPCDMMTPILADLTKKYEGKANVMFVHARENNILASRYGVQGIPVQIFFDKDGKETFRHTGFFPQVEIEKKFAEMGVK